MSDDTATRFGNQVIVDTIENLLGSRREDATICPSDVARGLAIEEEDWRASMPRIREVAAGLAHEGRLCVTRRGVEVEATSAGGPIRLAFPKRTGETRE